ncbi:DNA polymerase [Levilactobacillus acidifarinae]|uniref:DNA-directed DNA polymerase n=1 Tax=Levilactobacillus acidifarinae DSM 19394 = JCM 15949 TaxID=1423715 RepID=A0A0R1LGK3_9LACO|nr:DNA polymerase [Levilactobacillus acidifarinae]KRK95006.1 hypothetical protein FD25_GL002191 [Levilactobacillus acidifarinae DSM 19394]GEO70771.1 hypothetical protein LAC03_26810 [Levilactobacillus acidifarinae]
MLRIKSTNTVTDDAGHTFSWDSICHMLLWVVPTVLNQQSLGRANEYFSQFPLFQMLFKLECQALPVVQQMERNGLILNKSSWENEISFHKKSADGYKHVLDSGALPLDLYKEYQEERRLVLTFGDKLFRLSQAIPGSADKVRITGNWEMYGTNSGRFNCRQLPMMALPKLMWEDLSPLEDGYSYYSADLANFELRVAAALTGCGAMQEFFKRGVDVHSYNGDMFNQELHLDLDPRDCHKLGKIVAFTLMYGGSERRVLESIEDLVGHEIDWNGPWHVKQLFLKQYPEFVSLLMPNDSQTLHTPFGDAPINVGLKKTQMVNLPVQMCGAILYKQCLVACYEQVKSAKIRLGVHDELIFEVKDSEASIFEQEVTQVVEATLNHVWPALETEGILNVTLKGGF